MLVEASDVELELFELGAVLLTRRTRGDDDADVV